MQKMKTVLIADDEPLARRLLLEYLAAHPGLQLVAECADGEEALRQMEALKPDLVLLDIHMPRLSGIEVLEASGRRSGVIFTTAYDAHAIKAFELHAVDYLLKPFTQQRFDAALARAAALGQVSTEPALLAAAARGGEPLRRLLIREREQLHVIPVEQVEWLQAQGDYLAVHAQGRSRLKLQKISEIEAQLDPAAFVRVHRSAIVNVAFLAAIERHGAEGHAARLADGSLVPVSRSGLERLRDAVGRT
ncbi:LytTR family DNA-binding domain-containing protein [Pelomonas sp. KK5]|uniref:LytR/AlgR family response regulator transcription factor n=1 Tax=Pelomonas sp. KK5 TaxID=1855730 RepID=UPI001E49D365|nr:LytTR family DNA-binding domain-containing protein [Pelomonas sp. KK5]